ncbi:hypothetical protein ZWY2020_042075 [Hordeum vulgare]|nr:hypothetical protein ZWY2020_042075 [Hordeum vulgare]
MGVVRDIRAASTWQPRWASGGGSLASRRSWWLAATLFRPHRQARLGEAMAVVLMQVFFTVVAKWRHPQRRPHGARHLGVSVRADRHALMVIMRRRILGMERKLRAHRIQRQRRRSDHRCWMATTNWASLVVPGILAGILGIAIATFLDIAFGMFVLKHM